MVFVKTNSVQIQVKQTKNGLTKSKSFTIYEIELEEAHNRIRNLFEMLSQHKNAESINTKHYPKEATQ